MSEAGLEGLAEGEGALPAAEVRDGDASAARVHDLDVLVVLAGAVRDAVELLLPGRVVAGSKDEEGFHGA